MNSVLPDIPNILIIGATSSLAQAICRELADRGSTLTLAARDENELALLACDIKVRFGVECKTLVVDLLAADFSATYFISQTGDFDHVIIVVGDMGSHDKNDPDNIAYTAHINYTLPAQLATAAALALKEKGCGTIAIVSSVAGDRGRQSNYLYGSAKAALTAFASGLRNYLYPHGVHVMTIKPGFIDTPMTWGMKSPLIARRETVAEKIVTAMEKKKNVVYVPFFWRYIMLIIVHIPEMIFKRLKL